MFFCLVKYRFHSGVDLARIISNRDKKEILGRRRLILTCGSIGCYLSKTDKVDVEKDFYERMSYN